MSIHEQITDSPTRRLRFLVGVACLFAVATLPSFGGELRLHMGTFDPVDRSRSADSAGHPGPGEFHIVQFTPAERDRGRLELLSRGYEVHAYLPDNAYVVRGPVGQETATKNAVTGIDGLRWMGDLGPEFRLHPDLAGRARSGQDGPAWLEVSLWRGSEPERLFERLESAGVEEVHPRRGVRGQTRVVVRATASQAAEVARLNEVQWIEAAPNLVRRNSLTQFTLQSDIPDYTPVWDAGIRGDGQVIGHLDGAPDLGSCYFADPEGDPVGPDHRTFVAYYDPPATGRFDNHGTHTAGTIVGKNLGTLEHAGLAYEARIAWGQDTAVAGWQNMPSTLEAAFLRAQADGAFIHSNSWGDDFFKTYTFWCQDIDSFTWQNQDALVLFASTNLSDLRSPENAKNQISVNQTRRYPEQETYGGGGAGPTLDGRRKPDIVAPGTFIMSAWTSSASDDCRASLLTGTSAATPAVAAAAALVRQYYMDGYYPTGRSVPDHGFVPTGSLVKATLLNGTVDLAGVAGYPSNREGWGRLVLDNVLLLPGAGHSLHFVDVRHADGLGTGDSAGLVLEFEDSPVRLKATLAWADPPAAHQAAEAWINNLDLEVQAPDGTIYLGNVFDASGTSTAGGFPDIRNNVEQVELAQTAGGEWTFRVIGTNVPMGNQGFALVVTAGPLIPASAGNQFQVY